jgi:trk system potassium uptake protein TrkA
LLSADRGGVVALEDGSQEFAGIVTSAGIARVPPDDRGRTLVRAALAPAPVVLSPETPLDAALEQLAEAGVSWAPVVRDRRLLGELHVRDAIRTYRAMLHRGVRRASGLPANISYFEVRVSPRSALAGRTLAEAALPRGTLIIAITRDGETLFPLATTRIEAGDMLMVMADRESERTLAAFLGGNSSPASG